MHTSLLLLLILSVSCKNKMGSTHATIEGTRESFVQKLITDSSSWAFFLQHLPETKAPVLDFTGKAISYQDKHFSIINYDVGNRDLQQCADALMRLRAEYLFANDRFAEISFHFTSGHTFTFTDYCKGKKPIPNGNSVVFTNSTSHSFTAASLRSYLDIVYTYAGTISLAAELKDAQDFAIGTIVIWPGSPGHCFIITDQATTASGDTVFKLVEGYTPAQSIYVLQNTNDPDLGYWHRLKKGRIQTASYDFTAYKLKRFE